MDQLDTTKATELRATIDEPENSITLQGCLHLLVDAEALGFVDGADH